jgi:hypothetical protein
MNQLVSLMGLHVSPFAFTILYVLLAGRFGQEYSVRAGRGDWLARFPGPGTFQEHRIHWHSLDQWRGVELLALSFVEPGRLQQRYADVVWPDVFHRYGNFYLFRVRVDGTEVWKPVDRCDSSRELQSLRPRDFYPMDPRYW